MKQFLLLLKYHSRGSVLILSLLLSMQVVAGDCVILLHGLARGHGSMQEIQNSLEHQGYKVVNYDYPSTAFTIETLAETTIPDALSFCPADHRIHFVTHSMGGILLRQYLSQHKIKKLGRVVMLAPPNHGSEVADKLHNFPGYELIHGPAGHQLGTDKASVPNKLGPANFEVGIIAGSYTVNLILSTMLPKPNDGKVSVASTRLKGMKDHIIMPVTHTFMMSNDKVVFQVQHFLKIGRFKRMPPSP
ncbi:MAG: alpha/beta fold hydrolase [Pseudomonadales bacterium]|nr:alpha/beta fold hydrolase [Pseudomonadales bacterium]